MDLANFLAGISPNSNLSTLRRAAILFAGRIPTTNERETVENGDDEALKSTIRNMMREDAFTRFLLEGANDQLLTNKYLNDSTPAVELLDESGYPDAFLHIEEAYTMAYNSILATNGGDAEDAEAGAAEIRDEAWVSTSRAIAIQPLRTITYFVNRERFLYQHLDHR